MFMFVDISVHCTDCRNINLVKLRCLFEMSEIDKMMKTGKMGKKVNSFYSLVQLACGGHREILDAGGEEKLWSECPMLMYAVLRTLHNTALQL